MYILAIDTSNKNCKCMVVVHELPADCNYCNIVLYSENGDCEAGGGGVVIFIMILYSAIHI